MDAQLHLITSPDPTAERAQSTWRLDESTVAAGQRGVALARQALRDAAGRRRPEPDQGRRDAA